MKKRTVVLYSRNTDYIAARIGYIVGFEFEGDDEDNEMNLRLAGLIAGVGLTF